MSSALISWYSQHKRDLPWRDTREPYAIWLSEVILQQTRVNQGMSYYHRFLELFPTVFDLAAASEGEVLKAWQGLGYYSRARNLHATAKRVAYEMGGVFPKTAAEMKMLKGVGDYTAAAIASFCYNECVPVLDGNVQRVVSRVLAMEEPVDKPLGKAVINKVLQEWIDPQNPALFNQAIMEFGALQCTPQKPKCEVCPIQADCLAFAGCRQTEFPMKAAKIKVSDLWMYYVVAVHEGHVLVRHRQHSGIWKGLYDFPSLDSEVALDASTALLQWCNGRVSDGNPVLCSAPIELFHVLSHRRIHAVFLEVKLPNKIASRDSEQWMPIDELENLGVSRLVDRYIQEHGQVLH
jgi:A/G-specific adenine glycosylase